MLVPASGTATQDDDANWLRAHGWHELVTSRPWRWWKRPYRGAYYRLKDAIDIERSKQCQHH